MHVDSGECGSISAAFPRDVLLALVSCACASCVTPPEPRAQPAAPAPEARAAEESKAEKSESDEPEEVWPTAGDARPAREQPSQEPTPEPAQEREQQGQGESPTDANPPSRERPAEAPAAASADERETGSLDWLHGSLSVRYRGRTNGDDTDQDVRGVLALDLADPGVPWISGHLLARVDADLEGHDGGEAFQDLSDTYDESVVGKLYLAYADVALASRPEESPGTLRIGRQSDPRLPEVLRLDGLTYVTRPYGKKEVELGLYGGFPVRLYDSSSDGDQAYGTFVEGIPWNGGRARFDWMHLEDEELLGAGNNDLLTLGLWQDLQERWRLEGEFSYLEGDPRDLRFRALYDGTGTGSGPIVRAGYYELLETQTTRVTELDPFTEELLDYFPFRQTTLNVSQAIGSHAVLDAGFDVRRVRDSGDVGEFNRDWERYYLTATLNDLATEGLGLSVTADRWDDDDRDTSTLGADLSYEAEERWRAAIGSYYSLYKYELLELDERDDVRTYYLRASREVSASLELDLIYELENDDLDVYQTLRLGALWRF